MDELESLFDDDLDDPPPLPPPLPNLPDVSSSQLQSHTAPQSTGNDAGTPTGPGPLPTQPPPHDGTQGPPAKKRKPLLTLKVDRIFSEKGLPYLENEFPKIKFRGKGHEAADLKLLMRYYEHWGNRLYPKFTFKDLTERIEKLSTKKEFKNQLLEIRRRHAVINGTRQANGASSPQLDGEDEPASLPDDENEPTPQPATQPDGSENGPASRLDGKNGWFDDEDEATPWQDVEEETQQLAYKLDGKSRPPWLDDDEDGRPTSLLESEEAHSPTPHLSATQSTLTPADSDAGYETELSSLQSGSRGKGRSVPSHGGTSQNGADSELTPSQEMNCTDSVSSGERPSVDHVNCEESNGRRPINNTEIGTNSNEKDLEDGMNSNSELGSSEDQEVGVNCERRPFEDGKKGAQLGVEKEKVCEGLEGDIELPEEFTKN